MNAVGIPATQLAAWTAIIASGALGRYQRETYDLICRRPGITRNQIDAALAPGKANPPHSRRLAELERMGLIHRSGHMDGQACCWATPAMSVKPLPPKRLSAKAALRKVRALLASGGVYDALQIVDQALGGAR